MNSDTWTINPPDPAARWAPPPVTEPPRGLDGVDPEMLTPGPPLTISPPWRPWLHTEIVVGA